MVKTFLHSGKLGDIIWSLPTIKHLGGGTLYLKTGVVDPVPNEVMLTKDGAESIMTLLRTQEYIHNVEIYNGQSIDHDLNDFRKVVHKYQGITIAYSFFIGLGIKDDVTDLLNSPWITIDKDPNVLDKIIISRTPRYLGMRQGINNFYSLLKERNIAKHAVFLGTEQEHELFERIHKTGVPYYKTTNILDLARAVAASKFYVGNENLVNALNESMKKISFMENNKHSPNLCLFNRPDQFII